MLAKVKEQDGITQPQKLPCESFIAVLLEGYTIEYDLNSCLAVRYIFSFLLKLYMTVGFSEKDAHSLIFCFDFVMNMCTTTRFPT